MKRAVFHRRLTLCALLAPGLAAAQTVATMAPDPMRPLAAAAASAQAASAASSGATPVSALPSVDSTAGVRKLLAIRQDNTGERAALFGDRWLRAGDRYAAPQGEMLVLAVGSNHIELEQDKVRSTHHLLAPLLPPQWPTLPPAKPAPRPAPGLTPPPATPPTATAASALRTERP